jgi:DNA-binding winged helix-turn-helix (wHTH) protein
MSIKTPTHGLTLDDAGQPQAAGRPLKLPPKERAVLRLLLAHAPTAVRKDEFARQAWAGGEMSDESLARCISRVRRALQPHGLKVEAVYGLGYRLVEQAPQHAGQAGPSAQAQDSYAHARQLMQQRTPTAMGMAVELLRALVRSEPAFAAARVALADALAVAVGWGQLPTPAAVDEGLAALNELDGGLDGAGAVPGLHAARGALLDMAWRFNEARHCFDRARATDGDSTDTLLAYARRLLYTDEPAQAVAQLRRVRQLAPHALHVRMTLTRALVQGGRGAEAVAEAQATVIDHPGQLVTVAFSLAIQAMVAPQPELEAAALRLTQGLDTPPFVWTVASFVLSRLGRREAALDIVDTALLCSRTTAGEATLYAAPLAALGELDRAAALLRAAVDERCGMMAMVLRDPAHAHWLPHHAVGRALLNDVFGVPPWRAPMPVEE